MQFNSLMNIEPKTLNIALHKRHWKGDLFWIVASIAVAWSFRSPSDPLDMALTCVLGGATVAMTFGPFLHMIRHHRFWVVSVLASLANLVLCVFVLRTLIPWLLQVAA